MPRGTGAAIVFGVVGTREEMNLFVDRVRVIPEFFMAVTAVEIIRKQMLFAVVVLRGAALGL